MRTVRGETVAEFYGTPRHWRTSVGEAKNPRRRRLVAWYDWPNGRSRPDGTPACAAPSRICIHRKRIDISTVLAGQRVGIKEVDDGIRIVGFTR